MALCYLAIVRETSIEYVVRCLNKHDLVTFLAKYHFILVKRILHSRMHSLVEESSVVMYNYNNILYMV